MSYAKNVCGKLFSSSESPITFYELFKVTRVLVFIPDFNLLIWELHNFVFKVLYWTIFYWYYIKTKQNYNTFTVSCENSKIASFASSIVKNIVLLPSQSKCSVKMICCIAFGSVSSAPCLLKSIAIILW